MGGLHISPRNAPSKGAKLCTYLRWFARPDRISTEPYYELPLPVTKLRSIFHFRVGAHSLPVEQGRIEMPKVPRHLRRCTFCAINAIGDERHCVFDCPRFQSLRQQHAMIFRDSHDAMRSVMWHKVSCWLYGSSEFPPPPPPSSRVRGSDSRAEKHSYGGRVLFISSFDLPLARKLGLASSGQVCTFCTIF